MNKTDILKNYNIDKIVAAKDLAQLSRSYQDNLETLIVMMKRKQPKDTTPAWFKQWSEQVYEKKQPQWFKQWNQEVFSKVLDNQAKDHELLLKVIKLNNLKTK